MAKRSDNPFSPDKENDILDSIAQGDSLRTIARRSGMPSPGAIVKRARTCEDFGKRYAAAREAAIELQADELLAIADDSDEDVQRSRLRVDVRKWLMSKLIPTKYGDKMQVSGNDGGPIEIRWKLPDDA